MMMIDDDGLRAWVMMTMMVTMSGRWMMMMAGADDEPRWMMMIMDNYDDEGDYEDDAR